jgi:N-acetylmuramoyl-L-alanine amidase
VRYGSTGQLVSVLQAFLVCHGYKEAYVDGDFGSGTKNALTDYQRKFKLEVDGIAGQETFKSLCT